MTIGDKIRAARIEKGWTMRKLSKATGYTEAWLGEIERDRRTASARMLATVERALGVKLLDKEE